LARTIADLDARGVTLAAIQGLNAKLEAKDAQIAAIKDRLEKVESSYARDLADLRMAVEILAARTSAQARDAQSR
jgi:hypothetical protein